MQSTSNCNNNMLATSVLLVLVTFNVAAEARVARVGPKISYGNLVDIQQYPYVVSLDQSHGGSELKYCTGSIISSYWVLTSGRCVQSENVGSLVIRAGSANIIQGSKHEAAEIIVHPKYTSVRAPVNDIGLVRVKTAFQFSKYVQAVRLSPPNTELPAGTSTTVVGWGYTSDDSTSARNYTLQEFTVPLISNADCNHGFEAGLISDAVMCADYDKTRGRVNKDDYGAPVIVSDTQVGIVSWTRDYIEYYDILTNVSTYRNWIASETGI